MKPVSVIIPTYNRANLVVRAVNSVLQQTVFSGEILVIDDGSDDNTEEILAPFWEKKVIRYEKNTGRGVSAARNYGVALSRYDYIAFLDSDDHWKKDKLQKQLKCMQENPGFDICHTKEVWLRRGQHLNQKNIHIPGHGDIFDHCLILCAVGMSTVLLKKSLFHRFNGFDESMVCCEDYDLWLRVASQCPFLLLPEALTVKEGGREDQLSYRYRIGMDKYRIYAITKLLESYPLNNRRYANALQELKKKCEVYGKGCLKYGKIKEADTYLNLASKYER